MNNINTADLQTVSNYAKANGYSPARIHQLINENRLTCVDIDGVRFVNKKAVIKESTAKKGRPEVKVGN